LEVTGTGFGGGGTTVARSNLDASGITHSLVTSAGNPGAIVVDGGHIYWANGTTFSIGRSNLGGSGANPTWLPLGSVNASGIALDGTYIYWADGSEYIGRARLDGSAPEPHFIDFHAGSYPSAIALTGSTLYVTEPTQIVSVPAGGGSSQLVTALPANSFPTAMAASGGYLYFSAPNLTGNPAPTGTIGRVQINGTGLVDSYIANLYYPTGVATDGTWIYWVDHGGAQNQIGRALLGSTTTTNRNDSFISEPGGPAGVAVDSGIDPTTTTLSCTPTSVATGNPTTCTAVVHDSASTSPPTGNVNLTGNGATFFSGNPCTLTPLSGGGGSSCVVGAVPTVAGTQTLIAAYSGDPVHSSSSGTLSLCAGSACTSSGGGGGGPGGTRKAPACVVPKLLGKSLAAARKALASAHCKLGKVTKPKARRGRRLSPLVVAGQGRRAGTKLPEGAGVSVRLGVRKKHR
jgi:virginiamycin B lyase